MSQREIYIGTERKDFFFSSFLGDKNNTAKSADGKKSGKRNTSKIFKNKKQKEKPPEAKEKKEREV